MCLLYVFLPECPCLLFLYTLFVLCVHWKTAASIDFHIPHLLSMFTAHRLGWLRGRQTGWNVVAMTGKLSVLAISRRFYAVLTGQVRGDWRPHVGRFQEHCTAKFACDDMPIGCMSKGTDCASDLLPEIWSYRTWSSRRWNWNGASRLLFQYLKALLVRGSYRIAEEHVYTCSVP